MIHDNTTSTTTQTSKHMQDVTTSLKKEVEFFEENGFLGPFKIYEPEEAKEILKEVRAKSLDRSKALYDNHVNYDRHFDIPLLRKHISHPEIVRRLQAIIGLDIFCWRSEFFPKYPGSKGTEWHQVETFKYTTGNDQLVPTIRDDNTPMELTVWVALTDTNKDNGCLKFMPGSHKQWFFDESKIPDTGRNEIYDPMTSDSAFFGYNYSEFKIDSNWEPDESKAAALEMKAGEAVIFTARCMHGSFPNTTKRSTRFGMNARYVPTHVMVYPNQTSFIEHGGYFDLSNYGCVLVSGNDEYKHNKIRTENNLGEPFLKPM